MKEWLGSKIGKGVGIGVSCLAAAGLVVSLLWMAAVSFVEPADLLLDKGDRSFFVSGTFRGLLRQHIRQELEFYGEMWVLSPSGEIDQDILVDVLDLDEQSKITGKNVNGLAYTLGDLLDWGRERVQTSGLSAERILVCETPYGDIQYHYMKDLLKQVERGELIFQWDNGQAVEQSTAQTSDQDLMDRWESTVTQEYYYGDVIYGEEASVYPDRVTDKQGNTVYTHLSLYTGYQIKETYFPQGADSLLDVVNQMGWDLSYISECVSRTVEEAARRVETFEAEKNERPQDSNVQYLYVDLDGKRAFSNKRELEDFKGWKETLDRFRQIGDYTILTKGTQGTACDSNMSGSEETWRHWVETDLADTPLGMDDYVFAVAIDPGLPVQDWLYTEKTAFHRNVSVLKQAIGVGIASAVLFLASLIWLTLSAGRSEKRGQVALNFFDMWKTEVSALLVVIVWGCLLAFYTETGILGAGVFSEYLRSGPVSDVQIQFYICLVGALVVVTDLFFLWGYLSLVRRCKARTLWKNSILRVLLCQGKRTFLALKDIPRKAAALGVFLAIQAFFVLLVVSGGGGFAFFCLFLTQAAGVGWIVKVALEYQKIKKGVEKIAGGDMSWQIPEQGLTFDRKTLAQDINRIGEGLDKAVEESLRSERLKTELITNVSHDIKTPLTSIINYVDLLQREQFSDEKIQGYLDILEKKSQQLKTLTEDVVEASKASTGNLRLDYEDLDLVEMILQVNGEFQEKFSQQELELIQHLPDDPVVIRADGRRVWRILENIYQNVYKYAMPHTRVYVGLETGGLKAVFTMKNISQQPLDISADELTERFIRGDSARNSQGSGLGLSIAKSLTELQSGEFKLYLDGDLFKVWISFSLNRP